MSKQSKTFGPKMSRPPPDSPNTIAKKFGLTKANQGKAKAYYETLDGIIKAMKHQDEDLYSDVLAHLDNALEKLEGFKNAKTLNAAQDAVIKAGDRPVSVNDLKQIGNGRRATQVVTELGPVEPKDDKKEEVQPPHRTSPRKSAQSTTGLGRVSGNPVDGQNTPEHRSMPRNSRTKRQSKNSESSREEGEIREDDPEEEPPAVTASPKTLRYLMVRTKKTPGSSTTPEQRISHPKRAAKRQSKGSQSSVDAADNEEDSMEAEFASQERTELEEGSGDEVAAPVITVGARKSQRLAKKSPEYEAYDSDDN